MDVTFVTSNRGKRAEVTEILQPFGVRVRWSRRVLPEPQSESLAEVVRAKLSGAAGLGAVVLVEDSGLFIPALGGFPGVYSHFVLRTIGVPGVIRLAGARTLPARFETVAGVRRGRSVRLFRGSVAGHLAARPRGNEGFGFDPIFVPAGSPQTYAEMSPEEKNRFSHRGFAIRAVGEWLVRSKR
ncbi:MAG TPA: non-canonical purine NTP pyrophosphatase [Thermoplasmata archaeon]|nr:non-canonical purine NTP pyrophosphatase [Thermoplasmata archaeon]